MQKAAKLINEQKATTIVEHIAYDVTEDRHDLDIFTRDKPRADFSKAIKADLHIYDYVFTDSNTEREFVKNSIRVPTWRCTPSYPRALPFPPVGDYNPDWAIAFQEGKVKHVYFVAETKGSMSSMDLRAIEKSKIDCARKFFPRISSDHVKYDVVNTFSELMQLVK